MKVLGRYRVRKKLGVGGMGSVLLADEPTGNLDTATTSVVIDLLRGLTQRGTSVVMVTHERSIAARADAVVAIADGRIVHA